MTTNLWMLAAAAALYFVQILAAAAPRLFIKGMPWAVGPRDAEGKQMPEWAGRLQRACDNMQENLIVFAIVVLVVHAAGVANDTSTKGAIVFVAARATYLPLYTFGVPVVRTLAWAVGVVGVFMVAAPLL